MAQVRREKPPHFFISYPHDCSAVKQPHNTCLKTLSHPLMPRLSRRKMVRSALLPIGDVRGLAV